MWERRRSESKSLVQGVEMNLVIGVVPGGLPQGTCSPAEVGALSLRIFFFFVLFCFVFTFLKMDQLSLAPCPFKTEKLS